MSNSQNLDLKTLMARQNTGYITDVQWPTDLNLIKPINYIVRRDGLWEMRKSRAGVFVMQREKFATPLPGFPEENNVEYGQSHFGKIPDVLFKEIIAFFKSICDESKDEAYIQTFWDPLEKKWFNHVPVQRVSGASVNFERNVELESRCNLVLETHSHNTMEAFFSGTDNADEKSDRFFGVIGRLNQSVPTMLFSFVCGGKRVIINKSDIFESEPEVSFPSDWKQRITKSQPHQSNLYSGATGYTPRAYNNYKYSTSLAYEGEDDVDEAISEARRRLGGATTNQRFFPQNARSVNETSATEKDANASISNIITKFKTYGVTMTRVAKQRMFESLISLMSDDDVIDLVGCLLEAGHEETIVALLPEGTVGAVEVDLTEANNATEFDYND
jgi:PRTRC genetic system protein A